MNSITLTIIRFGKIGASVSFSNLFKDRKNFNFIETKSKHDFSNCNNTIYIDRSSIANFLLSFFNVARYLKSSNLPAFVVMPSPLDWLLLFKKGGRKTVYVLVHDDKTHKGDITFKEFLTQSYWRIIKPNIICLSSHVKNSLIKQGFDVASVIQHPYFKLSIFNKNKHDKLYDIGIFGRLKSYQGLNVMNDVLCTLKASNLKILVCGGNSSQFNYNHITRVSGLVDEEAFFLYMSECKYLLLPYEEATQSGIIPNALMMSCKIITTRVGGIPEQDVLDNFIYLDNLSKTSVVKLLNNLDYSSTSENVNFLLNESISPDKFVNSVINTIQNDVGRYTNIKK